mmetsp:Transcript_12776/g.25638  ORF Transcript_12776/g.25638 Transcript_12776/m.25638 type:complete len:95 (-) Transcript_12776:770-1054(-)
MDGSCRQNYFGPVVLWWVWDGSSSLALFQVVRFSVSDDDAVAHFSTVEWAFRELSAKCNWHSLGSSAQCVLWKPIVQMQMSLLVYLAFVVESPQ